MIIPGFNQSVAVEGETFHVQTEHHDAPDAPYIETLVYKEGKIILSRRFAQEAAEQQVAQCLRQIHLRVVEKIRGGALSGGGSKESESKRSIAELRELRKLVVRLERAVGAGAPREDVNERIRSVACALTVIAGRPLTSMLRRADAAEMLRYRDEAMALARAGNADASAALDLWRRVAASVCRLSRINRRRALLEHDHACARQVLARLAETADDERLDEESRAQLRQLWGRDVHVDYLIDHPGELLAGVARRELNRLDDELARRLEAPGVAAS